MLSKEWNEKIAATVIIYNYKYYYKMYYRIGLERIQTCFSIYSTIHLYPYFYEVRCGYLDGIYEMFFFATINAFKMLRIIARREFVVG